MQNDVRFTAKAKAGLIGGLHALAHMLKQDKVPEVIQNSITINGTVEPITAAGAEGLITLLLDGDPMLCGGELLVDLQGETHEDVQASKTRN